jgi:thioredoxin-related protein
MFGSVYSTAVRATVLMCLLGAMIVASAAGAAGGRDPLQYFFHQGFGDLKEELATARQEGKQGVMIMFNDPDCPWCHKMKSTVLNQESVQDYYRQHFRLLQVDTRGDTPVIDFQGVEMPEKDFAFKVNRVRATPVFIFYDLSGEPVMRYTGVTRNVEEFLWLGEFVADGHYKTERFTVYKREKLAASRDKS